jgi:hypothetical protein
VKIQVEIMPLLQSQENSAETMKVIDDARNGKNLVGPFSTVSDLMESLNA